MANTNNDRRIDYIEMPALDFDATKAFYTVVFGWSFTDFGPDYMSFDDGRLTGGFFRAEKVHSGGPLPIIYGTNLEELYDAVRAAGGPIVRETISFPGGRRFQFNDPSGNELAVWSDNEPVEPGK